MTTETTLSLFNKNAVVAESATVLKEMITTATSKRQLDIIIAVASMVQPNDDRFTQYCIPYREFGKILNPSNPDTKIIHQDIEDAMIEIFKSCFRIRNGSKTKFYHWVETAEIDSETKTITFKLNDEVQQFYLQLKDNKSLYMLQDLLSLSTMFQANVFRWLVANRDFKKPSYISIDDAKLQFYNDENIETKAFIRKLDNALLKINSCTEIEAFYEKIMKGKKIIALKFTIMNHHKKALKKSS